MDDSSSSGDTRLYLEIIWTDLKRGLNQIYIRRTEVGLVRIMELYTHVAVLCTFSDGIQAVGRDRAGTDSSLCTQFVGFELYKKLKGFFKAFVLNVLKEGKDLNGEDMLLYYTKKWDEFRSASKIVNTICEFFNKTWIKSRMDRGNGDIHEIYTLALVTWKQYLCEDMHKNLTNAMLKLIERDRLDESINADIIKAVIQCYVELDAIEFEGVSGSQATCDANVPKVRLYCDNFEKLFLEDTETFYTNAVVDFISSNHFTISQYMRKVHRWLYEEDQCRCAFYLHPSLKEGLTKTCEKVLIVQHLDLYKNGFYNLLIDGNDKDLMRMYSLCSRVNGDLSEVKITYEKHIKEQLSSTVKESDESDMKIDTILVLRRHSNLVERCFLNDPGFVQIVDKTWAAFINKVPARLFREELGELNATQKGYASTCAKKLIAKYIHLVKDEFHSLLIDGKDDDLARMYSLIHSVDDELSVLAVVLENHIEEQGASVIEKCGEDAIKDPKIYVNKILEIHRRYHTLVERSFLDESSFVLAFDKACAAFINKNNVTTMSNSASKSSELLARYCDSRLKKSAKNFKEAELEKLLADVVIVFKYIEDKAVFMKLYGKMLAKRLLSGLSINDKAELSLIEKLERSIVLHGYPHLKKLELEDEIFKLKSMVKDMDLGKELNDAFKEHQNNASIHPNLDFSIMVLDSRAWPLKQTSAFEIPSELVDCTDRFTDFYSQRHKGRILTWLPTMFTGELTTSFFQREYTFTASMEQIALLLMFNDLEEYAIGTLVEKLKWKKEVLVRVVQSLVEFQLLVLVGGESGHKSSSMSVDKEAKEVTPDLPDDAIIRLNLSFSHKKLNVDLSKSVLRTKMRQEQNQTAESFQ